MLFLVALELLPIRHAHVVDPLVRGLLGKILEDLIDQRLGHVELPVHQRLLKIHEIPALGGAHALLEVLERDVDGVVAVSPTDGTWARQLCGLAVLAIRPTLKMNT